MTSRMYENDDEEMASIMAWLDRRLEWSNKQTLPLYVAVFKSIWHTSFDTLDNIPPEYKDKITARYRELREREK